MSKTATLEPERIERPPLPDLDDCEEVRELIVLIDEHKDRLGRYKQDIWQHSVNSMRSPRMASDTSLFVDGVDYPPIRPFIHQDLPMPIKEVARRRLAGEDVTHPAELKEAEDKRIVAMQREVPVIEEMIRVLEEQLRQARRKFVISQAEQFRDFYAECFAAAEYHRTELIREYGEMRALSNFFVQHASIGAFYPDVHLTSGAMLELKSLGLPN